MTDVQEIHTKTLSRRWMLEFTDDEIEACMRTLDAIRETGKVNMFGAAPILAKLHPKLIDGKTDFRKDHGIRSSKAARTMLALWMDTYSARHDGENVDWSLWRAPELDEDL